MKILLTGSSGQLAKEFIKFFKSKNIAVYVVYGNVQFFINLKTAYANTFMGKIFGEIL